MSPDQIPGDAYGWPFLSQLGADDWVGNYVFPGYTGGFFVEAGAGDGLTYSNTYWLEKDRGWRGILVEPSRTFQRLRTARLHAAVDNSLLGKVTGEVVDFTQSERSERFGLDPRHELSGITSLAQVYKPEGRVFRLPTIALEDLLVRHAAPKFVHYLSLDVEGAELPILRAFPFDWFRFGAISIEHNGVEDVQESVREILGRHGYTLRETVEFDDWFTGPDVQAPPPFRSKKKPC